MGSRDRTDPACERAAQARRRSAEIADRLAELRQGIAPAAETVERAQQAAEVSKELAAEGYEHAAEAFERAADGRERAADDLELRAEHVGEDKWDLMRRAGQHRDQAARDRQEAATDRASAGKLRRPCRGASVGVRPHRRSFPGTSSARNPYPSLGVGSVRHVLETRHHVRVGGASQRVSAGPVRRGHRVQGFGDDLDVVATNLDLAARAAAIADQVRTGI